MSLYKILEISPDSSIDIIKKAYRQKCLQFHPDKNPDPNAREKFEEVIYAYNILKDEKSRTEYAKLNPQKENHFWLLLQGWIRKMSMVDMKILFETQNYDNINYILSNLDSYSLTQIMTWFNQPNKVPEDVTSSCIESETDTWQDSNCLYLDELPLKYLNESDLDINLQLKTNINEILEENKKKIKIKREINGKIITNSFLISCNKPFVVFPNAGDIKKGKKGNLIISLELEEPWNWCYDGIYLEKKISLYQMIYGVNFEIKLSDDSFIVRDWIPHRDGWKLFIDKNLPVNLYIKLVLDYQDDETKKEILFSFFN